MKYKNVLLVLCSFMACFSACEDTLSDKQESDELYMSVVARIGEANDVSHERYEGENVNNVEFSLGDGIGLFIDQAAAILWSYEAFGWITENSVYWADKENLHQFQAYYPCANAASSVDNIPMPGLLKQDGSFESISKCDFLVAETKQSYGKNGVVEFKGEGKSFHHISSLVHLKINGAEDLAASTLTRISINGANIVTPSTYSFLTGQVALQSDKKTDLLEVDLAHAMDGKDANFYFILNEKNTDEVITLTIDYTTGDKNYTAKLDKFANNTLVGGAQQSYSLTIKDSSLIITGNEVVSWDTGEEMDDIIIDAEEKKNE